MLNFSRLRWRCFVSILLTTHVSWVEAGEVDVSRRVVVMGTVLELRVSARDRLAAVAASQAVIDAVETVNRRLSTWREESELSLLNRAPAGVPVTVSPELEADLRDARHWWMKTGGLFDPGVASLVAAWDLRGEGRVPSPVGLEAARAASGFEHLMLGPGIARRATAAFGIEEGGFGKGIALRDAAREALEAGASCVVIDLGGQVVVSGACGVAAIDIAHPARRDHVVARVKLRTGSAATSGNSERGLLIDGVRFGHLLDPRTGRPAPDWGAVTVFAPDPVAADCLATALFVMGPRRGGEWLRGRTGVEAVFAENDSESVIITATAGLEGRLTVYEGTLSFLWPLRKDPGRGDNETLEITKRKTGS